jgi:acyl transferase domain-containing protein
LYSTNTPAKYLFLEIGPHPVLSVYVKDIIGSFSAFSAEVLVDPPVLRSEFLLNTVNFLQVYHFLKRDINEFDTMLTSLSQLHASGVVDW